MKYNVLIVDDQLLPRQYFESIINSSKDFNLVASISSAKVADVYCIKNHIDLIIMDIVMADDYNGLEAAENIKNMYPNIKILIVTSMPDANFLNIARKINVDSFWYKEIQEAPMLDVMIRTMNGENVYPDTSPKVKLGIAYNNEFTSREIDVLRAMTEGLSNPEIAEKLEMSVNTVKYHIYNLMSKTGIESRTKLAIEAAKSGIVANNV